MSLGEPVRAVGVALVSPIHYYHITVTENRAANGANIHRRVSEGREIRGPHLHATHLGTYESACVMTDVWTLATASEYTLSLILTVWLIAHDHARIWRAPARSGREDVDTDLVYEIV